MLVYLAPKQTLSTHLDSLAFIPVCLPVHALKSIIVNNNNKNDDGDNGDDGNNDDDDDVKGKYNLAMPGLVEILLPSGAIFLKL